MSFVDSFDDTHLSRASTSLQTESEALSNVPYIEDSMEEPPLPSPRPPLPEIMPLSNSEIPVPEHLQVQFINEASSAGNLNLSTFLLNTQCLTLPGANGAANSFHDLLVTCPARVQRNIPDKETFNEVKASSVSQKILPKMYVSKFLQKTKWLVKVSGEPKARKG